MNLHVFKAIRTCKWHHLKRRTLTYSIITKKNKKTGQQGNTVKHTHTKISILYLHVCRISFVWGECSHDAKKNFNQCHHKNYGNNSKVATILYWPTICHYRKGNDLKTIQDHDKSGQEGAEDVECSVGNNLERQKRNTTKSGRK